jgi:hypothetical protein
MFSSMSSAFVTPPRLAGGASSRGGMIGTGTITTTTSSGRVPVRER